MSISTDSRLWLATHLLYPNSSQAFDVYQSIVSQSEKAIKKNHVGALFKKLAQIVQRIPSVNSNRAFHVFENKEIDQWQLIYKRSNKEQLIIFIGVLIFEISLDDLSKLLKITYEKAHYLFHQTFKKSIILSAVKPHIFDKIKLKKQNDATVSFLYTSESLVDFCLNNLPQVELEKVRIGLQLYPELLATQKQYNLIITQIKTLIDEQENRVSETIVFSPDASDEETTSYVFHLLHILNHNKNAIAVTGISMVLLVLVMIRPQWIQQISQKTRDHFIVLQEVQPRSIENSENKSQSQVVLNELPVQVVQTEKKVQTVKEPVYVKNETVAQAEENNIAKNNNANKKEISAATTTSKKSGGLYRGVLIVTDLDQVTAKITEKIVDVGAKKAGEVELGWRKSPKLSYYHFTLPENSVDSVKEFLNKFGKLQIQFENHPRLMPAGVKRLIIEVKERE